MSQCPCCSLRELDECCGPILAGTPAPTAEALMRSRYTAFVLGKLDHVDRTHAPEIRADFNRPEAERLASETEWQGLEIRRAVEEGDSAEVEYCMKFRREKQEVAKVVLARFRRDEGQWFYVSSENNPHIAPRQVTKVGRNDPCPCGSGKKVKKCCGQTTVAQ
jgi:SEC-C motif-containing protein